MDASIGPPGTGNRDVVFVELAQRVFDKPLNGYPASLPLPTNKRPAVIRQRDPEARHGGPEQLQACRLSGLQKGSSELLPAILQFCNSAISRYRP
jgi:hypothetical protein